MDKEISKWQRRTSMKHMNAEHSKVPLIEPDESGEAHPLFYS